MHFSVSKTTVSISCFTSFSSLRSCAMAASYSSIRLSNAANTRLSWSLTLRSLSSCVFLIRIRIALESAIILIDLASRSSVATFHVSYMVASFGGSCSVCTCNSRFWLSSFIFSALASVRAAASLRAMSSPSKTDDSSMCCASSTASCIASSRASETLSSIAFSSVNLSSTLSVTRSMPMRFARARKHCWLAFIGHWKRLLLNSSSVARAPSMRPLSESSFCFRFFSCSVFFSTSVVRPMNLFFTSIDFFRSVLSLVLRNLTELSRVPIASFRRFRTRCIIKSFTSFHSAGVYFLPSAF
mmetsp:Transcript_4947/g.12849  ORF Transcript_4947/g.12849 Transcript_4947/m.12849 type:complete len:299 (+) Transcript_4947:380-1276(+)